MQREKEGYDISERADNYLNNPETRASRWSAIQDLRVEVHSPPGCARDQTCINLDAVRVLFGDPHSDEIQD